MNEYHLKYKAALCLGARVPFECARVFQRVRLCEGDSLASSILGRIRPEPGSVVSSLQSVCLCNKLVSLVLALLFLLVLVLLSWSGSEEH